MPKFTRKRLYEIIPAALIWSVLLTSIFLSFVRPLWVICFIIAFDLLWLFRITHFSLLLLFSWRNYIKTKKVDWLAQLKKIDGWQNIYHYILFPTYMEPLEVLDDTLTNVLKSDYPKEKMIVHVAGEERAKEFFVPKMQELKKKFEGKFFKLIFTIHPDNVVGEIKGKGANAHYAGLEAKKIIDNELKIPYENIICSYFDADTIAHPQYYAYLTYKYLTTENRIRKAYQPAVVYNNNIWDAPAFTRITAFGTVFWLLTELIRPERMYTFSSHSIPFKALVDFGFWQKDIVTDDSRVFLQGFFRYDGDFEVVPLYIPVSMDTVMDNTILKTALNLYKQQRRWAWGVEHIPYMLENFKKNKKISRWKKFKYIWNSIEGSFSWATAPLLIFILGRLPLFIASHGEQSTSVIVQNTPYVLEFLMILSMIGIFISAIFSIFLLPPRPQTYSSYKWLIMILQWLLCPITLIIFGSIPAIEAQTRLALGKKYHLGFWVTPKVRKAEKV